MTIQFRMNKENTTPTYAGLAPSEWAAISQIKTQKKEIRLKNLMDPIQLSDSLANAAKHPCHRAGLHLALSSTLNPAPVILGSHNHRGNVSNLKISQYGFRSSLKI
jgi:hypothetical protein